jgi:signal transduction histidine kinase
MLACSSRWSDPPIAEPVYVDRDMWEKVSNLLSNAFKFTFVGAVKVTLKSVDSVVELQVSDASKWWPRQYLRRGLP